MTWGQFIRWADPQVEENHYHLHTGTWPNPSRPGVAAVDRIAPEHRRPGRRRQERGRRESPTSRRTSPTRPRPTRSWPSKGRTATAAARPCARRAGRLCPAAARRSRWTAGIPRTACRRRSRSISRATAGPEIVVSLNDGFMHAFSADASEIWRFNYTHGKAVMYASEADRRGPQPGRLAGDHLHDLRGARCDRFRVPGDPGRGRPAAARRRPARTRATTGTAAARPRRPRCTTSTATASSRSSSRRSTTAWMSSRCPARPATACPGPPRAAGRCAWGSRTATTFKLFPL